MLLHRKGRRRDGATTVEFACVALLLFLLLFTAIAWRLNAAFWKDIH